ncbi:MAG: putative phospholipid-binding lipoprotein MlaA precursor [Smithella sp. PtaU1.Bin162]|nr:MAG: putative phospholipid-binding lipoprotein MlaA precursor [Smithella sp. PtaU1.Bin162]
MKIIFVMKSFVCLAVLFIFLVAGCAHSPARTDSETQSGSASSTSKAKTTTETSADLSGTPASPGNKSANTDEYDDEMEEEGEATTIADPLEPFNRAMYHFNDKLYFWMLKPVAKGYGEVVPEKARISIKSFFSNLGFPIRFLSCLLQADFTGAATEAGRFSVNTLWGIGGLMDPAAGKELDLQKQDTDFGLTLASYGVGHGFYIVWPVLGPSSPRDSVDIAGVYFLDPASYITPWYYDAVTKSMKIVNNTSLSIGEYEALQKAAIDPYVAMRDAYIQYRLNKVKGKSGKTEKVKLQQPGKKEEKGK